MYTPTHICICIYIRMCICIYICMYAYVSAFIDIHIYRYTYLSFLLCLSIHLSRSQDYFAVFFVFFSPYVFDFAGWWPNSLTPAAVVIFGPSYLRHVSKVPTFTGMRPLGVAILETFVVFGPLYLRHISQVPPLTGMRPMKVAIIETVVVFGSSHLGNDFQASLS